MAVRIAIVGNSGSGKTTLARKVAAKTGARHVEVDRYFHQPGWTPQDRDVLRAEIRTALEAPEGWVADGNYDSLVGDLIRGQAHTIVVFELPRALVMRRVTARTLRRAITREELWNGNREPMTNFYRWDPEKNILRWSWTQHAKYLQRHRDHIANGDWDHANVVVCRSQADADRWLASL